VPVTQHNQSADTNIIANTHTVCFMMTDGDNIQWLTNNFATYTGWYASPNRGVTNIGWTVSPAMAELAPTILKYFYDSAANTPTGQDYIVAGASGMGYFYPDECPDLDSVSSITSRMMKKADMHVLNIIGNLYSNQYFEPYLAQNNIDAILYYTYYGGYQGMNGAASCVNGKPVISARFTLWSGYYNTATLAAAINAMPANPNSVNGYSLVDVHVWDNTVDSVIKCVQMLDSNVRVVTPDAFVKLFRKGVSCDSLTAIDNVALNQAAISIQPNPANAACLINLSLPETITGELAIYDLAGRKLLNLASGTINAGEQSFTINASLLQPSVYVVALKTSSLIATQKLVITR
jgi:hypothetical protein